MTSVAAQEPTAQQAPSGEEPAKDRAPTKMSPLVAGCLLLIALAAVGGVAVYALLEPQPPPDGCTNQDPARTSDYREMTYIAVSRQTEGRTNYDTVVNLTSVCTQEADGIHYELEFTTAPSNCTINKDSYTQNCLPSGPATASCSASVYKNRSAVIEIRNYKCSPVATVFVER